jgi:serine/threonine-protein kinase
MDPQQGPPQPDLLIGQTVGNYLVTQKLGEGGMGSVYLAEHPTIGKKVALKILHAEFSNNPEVANRFFTEAKAVNAVGHPNMSGWSTSSWSTWPGSRSARSSAPRRRCRPSAR